MGLSYKKLWKLLIDKNITKTELCDRTGISRTTLTKLNNGENVNTEILERICAFLLCDISEIVEYESEDKKI